MHKFLYQMVGLLTDTPERSIEQEDYAGGQTHAITA